MSAGTVGRCSVEVHLSLNIRESTLEKSLMSAESVERASVGAHPLRFTRELTPERSLTGATTAGKPSVRAQQSSGISSFTLKSNDWAFVGVSAEHIAHPPAAEKRGK